MLNISISGKSLGLTVFVLIFPMYLKMFHSDVYLCEHYLVQYCTRTCSCFLFSACCCLKLKVFHNTSIFNAALHIEVTIFLSSPVEGKLNALLRMFT